MAAALTGLLPTVVQTTLSVARTAMLSELIHKLVGGYVVFCNPTPLPLSTW